MEFWQEMYMASCDTRRKERDKMMWYKRQYREAVRRRQKVFDIVTWCVISVGCLACVAAWVSLIRG